MVHFDFENNVLNQTNNVTATIERPADISYESRGGNQAIKFGGVYSPNQVNVASDPSFTFTDEITVAYFLKVNNKMGMDGYKQTVPYGAHDILMDRDWKINNRLFTSATDPSRMIMYYPDATQDDGWGRLVADHIPTGTWVHIAFVISKTTATSYVNGVVSESFAMNPTDFSTLAKGFSIGKSDDWYPLNGSLDDLRIYNRPLSSQEIQMLSVK
ncbi:hypothetical protein CEW92_01120 [Bacillaceae bacterium SAS-127]|nr:hypothetical protein CEW92_01120 [Bacillaceae bacterium SAS-127]